VRCARHDSKEATARTEGDLAVVRAQAEGEICETGFDARSSLVVAPVR
jgi:hypothetical protein